eukprot:scaffold1518_cov417-Prasinococcus_capsulatus_cf.AAC.14
MSVQGGYTNDWEEVKFSKKPQGSTTNRAAVNAAMRTGGKVDTVKKCKSLTRLGYVKRSLHPVRLGQSACMEPPSSGVPPLPP